MKISLLNKREDFEKVFLRSVKEFLMVRYGHFVEVLPAGLGEISFRKNSLLNLIYTDELPLSVKIKFTAEFKYSPNLFRQILQNTYCYLAVRSFTQQIFSPVFFDISNPPPEMRTWVFLPGNHSIRIIDIQKKHSIVFAKKGFDTNFLRTDAMTRISNPYLKAPKVLETNSDWLWYVEECIHGLPINKMTDPSQIKSMLFDAQRSLGRLRDNTLTKVNIKAYVKRILKEVRIIIDETYQFEDSLIDKLHKFMLNVSEISLNSPDFLLGLCQSHGDFQPANILSDTNSVWIIDWEYSAQRSTMYDFLVFTTMSRSGAGLTSRLLNEYGKIESDAGINSWGYFQKGDPLYLISIFLVEDLHLRLKEIQTDEINNKGVGIRSWVTQVQDFYSVVNRVF